MCSGPCIRVVIGHAGINKRLDETGWMSDISKAHSGSRSNRTVRDLYPPCPVITRHL